MIRPISGHPIGKAVLFLILLLSQTQVYSFSYEIVGKIRLDSSWERKIYLSAISSFDQMNTASEDFIINIAKIGPDGSFRFSGNNLPEGDRLYRLHVCKIGDPPATIFIGGREENHVHFAMNNQSRIRFVNDEMLFQNCSITGHPANALMRDLFERKEALQQPPSVNTRTNWAYNQRQLDRFLHQFADTCSHALVALLAVHQLNITQDYAQHPSFYKNILQKWQAYENAPYYQNLAQQVDYLSYHRTAGYWRILIIIAIPLAVALGFYVVRIRRSNQMTEEDELLERQKSLSVQEQRVFDLLTKGKANKEISSELNIEVSTVKSHLSNIYAKLGIKSRKEVYKWKEGDS